MKKLALLSNINGDLNALKRILNDIKEENIDEIICLGNAVDKNYIDILNILEKNNVKMTLGPNELKYLPLEILKKYPLYYECKISYDKLPEYKIYFSYYLVKENKLNNPFENNDLRDDINLWIKYYDDHKMFVIGKYDEYFNENGVNGILGDYIEKIHKLPNIYCVNSCKNQKTICYNIIEISKGYKFNKKEVKL